MLVEELGQKLNVVLYDHDDAPRADEFLGRQVFLHKIFTRKIILSIAH